MFGGVIPLGSFRAIGGGLGTVLMIGTMSSSSSESLPWFLRIRDGISSSSSEYSSSESSSWFLWRRGGMSLSSPEFAV